MRRFVTPVIVVTVIVSMATPGFAQTPPPAQPAQPAKPAAPAQPAQPTTESGMSTGQKWMAIGGIAAAAITSSVMIAKSGGDQPQPAAAAAQTSFGTMDANKDGALSSAEFRAGMEAIFKGIDANADGAITREEAVARYADKGGKYYDLLDTTKKGSVTAAAFTESTEKVFSAIDTNADGSVSAAERDAAKAKMAVS